MDALEYLKSLGPNPLSPFIKKMGFIMPGVAYELSMDHRGLDGKPIWGVTIAHEVGLTDDGLPECQIWHKKSQAFKTRKDADNYILDLIQELDP